ncbi:MAG: hypothetical protein JW982_11125 [Spirochaetes bacterium]|nr:hypothetical protein [Spirochaetota bacterium]
MMKKIILFNLILISVLLVFSGDLLARKKSTDYFFRPQVGIWFGPVTPMFELADQVDTSLGAGGYFRYNTFIQSLKIGFDSSYQSHSSDSTSEVTIVPVYGSLVYWLPLNFPINFQLKAGTGACWVEIKPDSVSQWDPMFTFGGEMSFPAGNRFNIGLRIDYHVIYEKYMDNAKYNGNFINAGLTLYLNL